MPQSEKREQSRETKTAPGPAGDADDLWRRAKESFYFRDDLLTTRTLCKSIITRFPLTEVADEARLLLHDAAIEKKNEPPVLGPASGTPSKRSENSFLKGVHHPDPDGAIARNPRVPIAIALVALPIIGLAQGSIVGIGVPEIIALLAAECVLQAASRVRVILFQKKPEITFSPVAPAGPRRPS